MAIKFKAVPVKPSGAKGVSGRKTTKPSSVTTKVTKAKPPAAKKKQLITRKAAIHEYGEEMGPIIAKLINSPPREPRPDARTRLSNAIAAWADAETGVTAHYLAFGAPPQAGTLRLALQEARAQADAGRWAILVFPPGKLEPVVVPERAPAADCSLDALVAFARAFRASQYWGGSTACEEVAHRIQLHWSRHSTLPEAPADELLTALHVAAYTWQFAIERTAQRRAYLQALHGALIGKLGGAVDSAGPPA